MTKTRDDETPLDTNDLVKKSNAFAHDVARVFFAKDGKNCRCKHCSAAWMLVASFLKLRIELELEASEVMSYDDWLLLEDVEIEGLDNIEMAFSRRESKAVKLADTILQSVKDNEEKPK